MIDKNKALQMIGLESGPLKEFSVNDTFNPGNTLSGFICMQSDELYGALVITHVNGKLVPQTIFATPKLHYPLDRESKHEGIRKYNFPNAEEVRVYEKLDGTNICAYSYGDVNGNRYLTFKTRLTPIVKDGEFSSFVNLWSGVSNDLTGLSRSDLINGDITLSYELHGYRNPHTVIYKYPLRANLLFGVRQSDTSIILPDDICSSALKPQIVVKSPKNLQIMYEDMRKEADAYNSTLMDDESLVTGTEGYIFYILSNNAYTQWKCKPESIEALHWISDYIPEPVIRQTALNSIESSEENTILFSATIELLKEEFSEQQILKSINRIEKVCRKLQYDLEFQSRVRKTYNSLDVTLDDGINQVMCALSKFFDRNEMRTVFQSLKTMGYLG